MAITFKEIDNNISTFVEHIILISRYSLVLPILALMFQILTILFDLYRVVINNSRVEMLSSHTLLVLQILDVTMIANLIWFICAGSFYVFVDKGESGIKRPRCLEHISSGILKEKMAGSLIGVSSIHLLQAFFHTSLGWMLVIHVVFIIGIVAFCYVNSSEHHDHSEKPIEVSKG